ncbi:hypothetical protein Tco_0465530 [Tanacetum coccineum]
MDQMVNNHQKRDLRTGNVSKTRVNPSSRSKDYPDAYKWIKANGQWLYDNFDHCEVETSDDDDDSRSL